MTGLAFSQAAADSGQSSLVSAGTVFLGMLGQQGLGETGSIDWAARYQTQNEFFGRIFTDGMNAIQDQSDLDWSRSAPPSAAIQAAAIGCTGINLTVVLLIRAFGLVLSHYFLKLYVR